MPQKQEKLAGLGRSMTFYLRNDVADKIEKHAAREARSESEVAESLLRQALSCPIWRWRRVGDEEEER
jgi:hypothetical protein